jgi:ubiquitin carboxyl-terminal hydrolase 4/11
LFDLKYFTGTKELVPAGWGSVDVDKDYPLLSSRNPQIPEAQVDNQEEDEFSTLNGHNQATSEVDSSDVEEDDVPQLAPTRMNDESSDDEPALNSSITRVCLIIIEAYLIS